MNPPPILPLKLAALDSKPLPLPAIRNWPESCHIFAPEDIHAINMALVTNRPLLLRGDPGCGKSQLARAAAEALKWPFISRVVNARFEPEDLLYRFDAVARLAKAQILPKTEDAKEQLHAKFFLLPEILWWALNPTRALIQYLEAAEHCGEMAGRYDEDCGHPFDPTKGVVVLIDEIDKADSDLPNSLLEILSTGGFHLPFGGGTVALENPDQPPPLIILTTNEDRELPSAFLRRCLVHQMDPAESGQEALFLRRVRAHFPTQKDIADDVLKDAIGQLVADRKKLKAQELKGPGQAELIDLVTAISSLSKTGVATQKELLTQLQGFVFKKHREN